MPIAIRDRGIKSILLYEQPEPGLQKLTQTLPLPLIAIGNRNLVEHQLEWFSEQGIRDVCLSLKDRPVETEREVGLGARWGVNASYSLAHRDQPLTERINKAVGTQEQPLLLMSGQLIVNAVLPEQLVAPCVFYRDDELLPIAFLTTQHLRTILNEFRTADLLTLCRHAEQYLQGVAVQHLDGYCFTLTSIKDYRSVMANIAEDPDILHFKGTLAGEQVRVGRMSVVSPEARLIGPALIGERVHIKAGAQIGPDAFIGDGVYVEKGVQLSQTVVGPATYIGPHTSFKFKYVHRNYVLDFQEETAIYIEDPVILGDLTRPMNIGHGLERFSAGFLLLFCLPLLILLMIWHRLSKGVWLHVETMLCCPVSTNLRGEYDYTWKTWHRFGFGYFGFDFIPSLFDILRGHMRFVGNPPLNRVAVDKLNRDWCEDLFGEKPGCTGLVQQLSPKISEPDDLFAASIYYNATRSFKGDLVLFLKAFIPGMHRFPRKYTLWNR